MGITREQANLRLSKINSPEQLQQLIKELDVTGTGKTTLLWSGSAGFSGSNNKEKISAQRIANSLATSNSDFRILANTEAARFLDLDRASKNFNHHLASKLDALFSDSPDKIREFLYGSEDAVTKRRIGKGIWDAVSENFVKQAQGDVRLIVGGGGLDRIFAQTELRALMGNQGVRSIEGVPIAALRAVEKANGIIPVTKLLMGISEAITGMIKMQVDGSGRPILEVGRTYKLDATDYIKMNSVNAAVAKGMRSMHDFIPIERRLRHVQVVNEIYRTNAVLRKHGYVPPIQLDPRGGIGVFSRAATYTGFIGDVASVSLMAQKATEEMSAGNHREAHNTVASWAFETVGGFAAGRIATVVVAPLMMTGPIGFLIGAGIILGSSIIGSELGKRLFKRMKDLMNRQFEEIIFLISPLVLDLDGNGVQTLSLKQTYIHFDHDNNGFLEQTGWVGSGDGLLILDLNGNGSVDSGAELFGSNTLLPDGQLAADGFMALAMYDSNTDQRIDHLDPVWNRLRVWKDQNSNATTEPGEWLSMADLQIKALHLGYYINEVIDANGNKHNPHGFYERLNGQVYSLTDVWFAKDTLNSLPPKLKEVDEETAIFPDVSGMGIVPSLHQALMNPNNASLRQTLTQWLGSTRLQRMTLTEDLLFQWVEASNNPFSLPGRTYLSDDDLIHLRVAVVEKLFGDGIPDSEEFVGINRSAAISALSQEMVFYFDMLLNVEVSINPLFQLAIPVESDDHGPLQMDLTDSVKHLRSQFQKDPDPGFIPMIQWQLLHHEAAGQAFFQALQSTAATTPDALQRAMRLQRGLTAPWEWRRGTNEHDEINGSALNDFIEAGSSYDYIWGKEGDDTLQGGPGRDFYYGGKGGDTYYISQNSEGDFDTILDDGSEASGLPDRLVFWDLTPDDVQPVLEDQKLIFYAREPGYEEKNSWEKNVVAIIHNQFNPQNRIEEFHFTDGVVWSYNTLLLQLPVKGTDGNDKLTGVTNTSNRLHGLGGDDTLTGGMLTDHLEGHLGKDRLTGLAGADTLIGGPGDDTLEGGEGGDSYVFSANSGHDRISDQERRANVIDKVLFTDLTINALTRVTRTGQSLRLQFGASASLTLVNQMQPFSRVESFVFANGTAWDHDTLLRQIR
jgi:hypothetical protein